MGPATKPLSHLRITLPLPYAQNHLSQAGTPGGRGVPRSSAAAEAGERSEGGRSSSFAPHRQRGAARRAPLCRQPGPASPGAGGAEPPAGGGSTGRCCHLLPAAGTGGRRGGGRRRSPTQRGNEPGAGGVRDGKGAGQGWRGRAGRRGGGEVPVERGGEVGQQNDPDKQN